jgi:23S rRNA pseudouridine1911/1915/1917 synthase
MDVMPAGPGRPAQTRYETVASYRAGPASRSGDARFSLLRCFPLTGRTHQIRIHLAHIGHPIAGDPVYAGRRRPPVPGARLFLHAHRLRFRLPSTGAAVEFTSPLPPDLADILERLYKDEKVIR